MKKVLIITQHLDAGGVESTLLDICRFINKKKFEIEIFCCNSEFIAFEKKFSDYKIYKAAYINSGKGKIRFLYELFHVLRKGNYDVVHSNMGIFDGFNLCIAKLCGIKKRISHGHFRDSQYATSFRKSMLVKTIRLLTSTLIYFFSTDCIACSEEANEYCFNGKGKIIYNGIDLSQYIGGDTIRNIDGKLHICTIERISYAKNPLFIVDIMNELVKITNNVVFTWIGTGGLQNDVMLKVKDCSLEKYFNFLGLRFDVSIILRNQSYFLLPSLAEGLSVALIEAQASGCDCFVSDNVPQVADCGKVKFLPIDDAKVWAEIVWRHSQEKLWETNYKLLDKFDIRNTVLQIEGIYEGSSYSEKEKIWHSQSGYTDAYKL